MTKRSTSKCVECGKAAVLEPGPEDIMVGSFGWCSLTPACLCNDHWHLWWYIGQFLDENGKLRANVRLRSRTSPLAAQERSYYNRLKKGERFVKWLEGNKVEGD